MFSISYADNPDVAVFSFWSVGDTVKIGRDKRVCRICLGAAAQGVSRVHLCIQLKRIGATIKLMCKDLSTYGSAYNGGPLTVQREERELRVGDTLQIGNSEFVIGERPCEDMLSGDDAALRGHNNPQHTKRSAVFSEGVSLAKKSKRSFNYQQVESGGYSASALLDEVDAATQMMTQPRILANDSRLVTQTSNCTHSVDTPNESVSSAGLLPCDDRDSGSELDSQHDVLLRRPLVLAQDSSDEDTPQKRRVPDDEVGTTVPESEFDAWEFDEERIAVLNTGQRPIHATRQNRQCNLFDSLCGREPSSTLNDSIVAGPSANQGRIADIDPSSLTTPAFHSTQRESFGLKSSTQHRFIEPNTQPHRTPFTDSSRQPLAKARHRRTPNQNEPSFDGGRGGRLMSWINQSKRNDQSSVFDSNQFRKEVEGTQPKKVKVDLLEESTRGTETTVDEAPQQEQNDNDLIIGLDLQTLKHKLENIVEYSNLERRSPDSIRALSQVLCASEGSHTSSASLPNFKTFTKAQQGCYSQQSQPRQQITQIIGTTDMVDFRSLC